MGVSGGRGIQVESVTALEQQLSVVGLQQRERQTEEQLRQDTHAHTYINCQVKQKIKLGKVP